MDGASQGKAEFDPGAQDAIYHAARALEEMDRGFAASCLLTAKIHLKLASMHFTKAKELGIPGHKPLLTM